jgi:hypothetical protein
MESQGTRGKSGKMMSCREWLFMHERATELRLACRLPKLLDIHTYDSPSVVQILFCKFDALFLKLIMASIVRMGRAWDKHAGSIKRTWLDIEVVLGGLEGGSWGEVIAMEEPCQRVRIVGGIPNATPLYGPP